MAVLLFIVCWRYRIQSSASTPISLSLSDWPSLWTIYFRAFLSALLKPRNARGDGSSNASIIIELRQSVPWSEHKLSKFDQIVLASGRQDVPVMYPIVEAFRLVLMALTHPAFPCNVVGSVLGSTHVVVRRPLLRSDCLKHMCHLGLTPTTTKRGHQGFHVTNTATDASGVAVWESRLEVVVVNPKTLRQRRRGGAEAPPAAEQQGEKDAQEQDPAAWPVLQRWRLGPDAGRRYAALNGDVNPVHMAALAARLFGFRRAVAHGLFVTAQAEAALWRAGVLPPHPLVLDAEFKRPSMLPSDVVLTWRKDAAGGGASPPGGGGDGVQFAVLEAGSMKELIGGRFTSLAQ